MKKRILVVIVALLMVLVGMAAFTACNTCEHRWAYRSEEVLREPTCTQEGEKACSCYNCGAEWTEKIPKIDHDYSMRISTTATCTTGGTSVYRCTMCGQEESKYDSALGHDYSGYFCKRCQRMDEGFSKVEFNSGMFDSSNLFSNSLGSFILSVDAVAGSKDVEVSLFASGKTTGMVVWTAVILNDTEKSFECSLAGSGSLRYGSTTLLSKEGQLENPYSASNNYYIKLTVSKL